jgi:hypothetical protein
MNITVWGINYAPEQTGIAPYNTALCEFLQRQGHTVRMVTSFAYYPAWQKRPEDRGRLFRTEEVNGVTVDRCWHYVPRRPGTLKRILPDSHTDFIFAVTGEEFGVLFCIGIVLLFAFIVLRVLWLASKNEDPFCRFASAGLVMLFGLQSAINMAVNVHLMPAKGMTLPFISYGGSSLISLALAMGFLIAVTRRRPKSQIIGRVME